MPVYVPFTEEEALRFRSYLKSTSRKAGPWFRSLAIRAMDEADGAASSCGEARELAAFIASLTPAQVSKLVEIKPALKAIDAEQAEASA